MWTTSLSGLIAVLVILELQGVAPAPSVGDWQERLADKQYAAELYNTLQNYLAHESPGGGLPRMMAAKRNSEIINSLLALPNRMAEIGR